MSKKKILLAAAVFCAAFVCMFPLLQDHFYYDDVKLVQNNPALRAQHAMSYFKGNLYGGQVKTDPFYRPLHMLSLLGNKLLLGNSALYYRLVNLILHGIASVMIFLLLASFMNILPSFLGALLFAVHPVHVESVAIIFNRSDILAVIFLCVAVLTIRASRIGPLYAAVGAGLFYILALMSKETAVVVFLLLALVLFLKRYHGIKLRQRGMNSVFWSFLLISFLYILLRIVIIGGVGASQENSFFKGAGFSVIFPTMSRVFLDYFLLNLFPICQRISYADYELSRGLFESRAIFSYLFHVLVLSLALINIRKRTALAFLLLAIYVSLIPVSQIVPFMDIKAERFLYLPSIFFCALPVLSFAKLKGRSKHFLIAGMVALSAVFFVRTLQYSSYFKAPQRLWEEMTRRAPDNHKFQFNLGADYLYKSREAEKALPHLARAVELEPDFPMAYAALGIAYSYTGQLDCAGRSFRKGLEKYPENIMLNFNYSVFLYKIEEFGKAYHHVMRVLKKYPSDREARDLLQEIKLKMGDK